MIVAVSKKGRISPKGEAAVVWDTLKLVFRPLHRACGASRNKPPPPPPTPRKLDHRYQCFQAPQRYSY